MNAERNFANIDRSLHRGDGQALQHFMTTAPWSGAAVFAQIQAELKARPEMQHGSALILDESADEKAGEHSVGAARQHNGRLGKVDVCRVDTCLAYSHIAQGLWTLVDGELFLPQAWLSPAYAARRRELGVPPERSFQTKLQLGLTMIRRARANGLPFEVVACDTLYGRSRTLRAALDAEGLTYAADVPADTPVYRQEPRVGVPRRRRGPRAGRQRTRVQVLSRQRPVEVRALARRSETQWEHAQIRHSERGVLEADFAFRQVWTLADDPTRRPRMEWLVIRRDASGDYTYALLNAPADTPHARLIWLSTQRYFVERTLEDAKTEIGWDEFQAQKYRAWEHHLALTGLALWFVAETKLDWRAQYARDPELARQLEVEVLPALSTANVRELLQAVLPLPDFTPEQATEVVVAHLVKRARSTRSRLESQREHELSP